MTSKSKLGLGFMRHDLNKNNQGLVDYAMANNINYFETCYFYLDHQCENYVYSLLQKYNRESYEICGKMSLSEAFAPGASFKTMFYDQLKRVPKHYFDVYILQTLRPQAYSQVFCSDLIDFLLNEKRKGNIGRFGFSEQCDSQLLSTFLTLDCWDIAQMALNYYDWYLCEKNKNYELITSKNIPIIAQAPYKGGFLINDLSPQMIKILEQEYSKSPSEIALDFVNDKQPEYILAGCSRLQTLKEYEQAHKNYSPLMSQNGILKILELYKQKIQIPCLLCGKCLEVCPSQINLPLYIALHNKSLIKPEEYFNSLCQLKYYEDEPVNKCIKCNICTRHCPLAINIPNRLMDIFNLRP